MATGNVNRWRGLATVWCLAASMAIGADETDPFGGKALKPGERHDGKVMTVDELVVCIDLQRDLDSQKRKADSLEINADLAQSRYRGLAQIIDAERGMLDTTDQHAIDVFNAKVQEQGAAVDAYNAVALALNDALSEQDALAGRFNAQCTTSTYYGSDLTKAYSIRERRLAASIEEESAKGKGKP
jgi:hypothetical protein